MKPIRSSLPSSSWLVATVVPWLTAVIAPPSSPSRPSTLRTPVRKPSAGSAGVDGVLVVVVQPVASSTATTSVKVPPVSMPMRTRRGSMRKYLRAEVLRGEASDRSDGQRRGDDDQRHAERGQHQGRRPDGGRPTAAHGEDDERHRDQQQRALADPAGGQPGAGGRARLAPG